MTVGLHTVKFAADPHLDNVWGPAFNINPEFTTDLAGWYTGPGASSWTWSAGKAAGTTQVNAGKLQLQPVNTLPKPATSALLRLTASVDVQTAATKSVTLRLEYQRPTGGPVYHDTRVDNPGLGVRTLEVISDPATIPAPVYNKLIIYLILSTETPEGLQIPAQAAAVDYLRLQSATAADLGVDLSCLVDQVTIRHGRDSSDGQPVASSATIDISTSDPAALPAMVDVGGVITITTDIPGTQSIRFKGRVTDISQGWEDAGPETPDRPVAQVIATGSLADLGRRVVGDTPWPQQVDGARVAAILAAAGVTLSPATSDPGTVQILPRDVDAQPALDVAQEVATDAGGMVWALRGGEIRYADANHRRNTVPALTLDSCDVLVTPTWQRTTEGLVNHVSIGYGVAPDDGDGGGGGEQPRYVADRPTSITKYGTYGLSAGTQLAALADAQAMGDLVLARNSTPSWILAALPVDVADLSAAETAALLSLEVHDLVNVTGMPAAGSVPTSALLWVEGWSETLAWATHTLDLVVSGYCRTSPPPRWNDVNPATTWDTIGTLTWDDVACLGPPASHGRWDDQPATLRWDQIDPAKTWNTYAA